MKLFRNGHQATAVLVVCLMLFLFFLGINLVVKAASPGDLDGTFGFGLSGITYTDIGTASLDEAHAVALLSDGRVRLTHGRRGDEHARCTREKGYRLLGTSECHCQHVLDGRSRSLHAGICERERRRCNRAAPAEREWLA